MNFKRIKFIKSSFLFFYLTIGLSAQQDVIVQAPDNIKTIVFRSTATNNYTSNIKLGQRLVLKFDDLNDNNTEYSYKITHYDYNWQPSNLLETEYINGYDSDYIRDYESSFNTLQPYTHYTLAIPNKNTQIKLTGNYVISILDENNKVIFARPFIVYANLVNVAVSVHKSRNISSINTKQVVNFSILHDDLLINNPNEEIKVAIYQNNDYHTVIKNLKPQFSRGSQLIYKYDKETSFWGNNEFLWFDNKEIRNPINNIAKTRLDGIYNTYLYVDEMRANKPYTYYPDINGNFVVRTIDEENSATEADYSWIHFYLDAKAYDDSNDIYIYGDFNGRQLTEENRMNYDKTQQLYTGKLLLKQGFYNYLYAVQNNDGTVNQHDIPGSFYQTENNYTVFVYYRPFGSKYDQVIGYGYANSEDLRN
ncbi:MAG: DUF5103 domain-containing protein [Flavobacteriales bacterium]|nr:MAG: DUF5103 domain-containing protein [Flavobacteriales bacterium]